MLLDPSPRSSLVKGLVTSDYKGNLEFTVMASELAN